MNPELLDNIEQFNAALADLLKEMTGVGVDTNEPQLCVQMLALALNNAKAMRHRENEYLKKPEHELIRTIQKLVSDYND